jgi:hypothetical protein
MKLLTKEIRKAMPPLYSNESKGEDAPIICKFFFPAGRGTWYATEANLIKADGTEIPLRDATDADVENKENDVLFFGFVRSPLGEDCDELGTFALREMEELKIGYLKMERDLHFPIGQHTLRDAKTRSHL